MMTKSQQELKNRARAVAEEFIAPRAAKHDIEQEYPWENVAVLVENAFMGMTIPKEYGGRGMTYLDTVLVVEEMAKACGVTGRIVVEGNMGAISMVMKYGSEAQKQLAAKLVLAGDKPAICITEPDHGSAASMMTTRADKINGGYVLNGIKHWITGGGVSKLYFVFARVFDGGEELGIGGFMFEHDGSIDGFAVGKREPTMGLRSIPETEIIFTDMLLPASSLIEPPSGFKKGFSGLMNAYNSQRVGAGTVAMGIAQGAYEKALAYSKTRKQFGRPICEFQGLQWMLADMSIALEASRALLHKAAGNAGDGFPDSVEAGQAKIFAAESAIKVTNDALQFYGAPGYSRNNPMERMVRDARMFAIGGGTAQVIRTMVASRLLGMKLPQTRNGYAES